MKPREVVEEGAAVVKVLVHIYCQLESCTTVNSRSVAQTVLYALVNTSAYTTFLVVKRSVPAESRVDATANRR